MLGALVYPLCIKGPKWGLAGFEVDGLALRCLDGGKGVPRVDALPGGYFFHYGVDIPTERTGFE